MAKTNEAKVPFEKQFKDVFNKLCRTRSSGRAWSDSMTIIACTISNSVDKEMFDQREALYMRTIHNYTRDELDTIAQLFAIIMNALEDDPEQDFLGDLYSTLSLTNKKLCQVFTPYRIAEAMATMTLDKIVEEIAKKGFASVNDPACGAGVMLIAAANAARKKGINYQRHLVFVAQDIDFTAAMMCYISLSLLGCVGCVGVGNTLTEPHPSRENIWYMPMNILRRNLLEAFYHSK